MTACGPKFIRLIYFRCFRLFAGVIVAGIRYTHLLLVDLFSAQTQWCTIMDNTAVKAALSQKNIPLRVFQYFKYICKEGLL